MVGWHYRPDGHEFEQPLGDGEGQGGLACCSPWGHKELDTTKRLNNNRICISHSFYSLFSSPCLYLFAHMYIQANRFVGFYFNTNSFYIPIFIFCYNVREEKGFILKKRQHLSSESDFPTAF